VPSRAVFTALLDLASASAWGPLGSSSRFLLVVLRFILGIGGLGEASQTAGMTRAREQGTIACAMFVCRLAIVAFVFWRKRVLQFPF